MQVAIKGKYILSSNLNLFNFEDRLSEEDTDVIVYIAKNWEYVKLGVKNQRNKSMEYIESIIQDIIGEKNETDL